MYSCRKFIGVPDGAYVVGKNAHLYTDEYAQGYSSDTANFLLLRIEYGCEGKAYQSRSVNEERIDHEPVKQMSRLTRTILDELITMNVEIRDARIFRIFINNWVV